MKEKLLSLICLSVFILGCATNTEYQYYTGTTDYRIKPGSESFAEKFYPTSQSTCLNKGDTFDIRLQQAVFNQIFESQLQKSLGDKESELGVFLTVIENPSIAVEAQDGTPKASGKKNDEETSTAQNRRLVYTSYPREKNALLNQINSLIYKGKYQGGDLHLELQIVEFDKKESQLLKEVLATLVAAGKEAYSPAIPSQYSNLIDKLGQSLLSATGKDDLIATFEMDFLACGSTTEEKQIFLSTGDLVFVRQPQSVPFEWSKISIKPDKTVSFSDTNLGPQSYVTLSIIKRIPVTSQQ